MRATVFSMTCRLFSVALLLAFCSFWGCDEKSPAKNDDLDPNQESVKDIDGNSYRIVKIGKVVSRILCKSFFPH
jgi:hypothetical protein